MEEKLAKRIFDQLATSERVDDFGLTVFRRGRALTGYHDWANGRPLVGALTATRAEDTSYDLLFIEWNPTNGYYLVVYPADRSGPLAEIHRVEPLGAGVFTLAWTYKPSKRDGRNEERTAYFRKHFLDTKVRISVPRDASEVGAFLDEVFALAENRLRADALTGGPSYDRETFQEGRIYELRHLARERNGKLVQLAKASALERDGTLACQVCGFDFGKVYGDVGREYIEAHHTVPVSQLEEGSETRLEDIALVCANCHRMLHRKRPWLTMKQLKSVLKPVRRRRS